MPAFEKGAWPEQGREVPERLAAQFRLHSTTKEPLEGDRQQILRNKGKLIGQKPTLTLKEIWAIRVRLQVSNRTRDLALFNLAIDSKSRACDFVSLHVRDVAHGNRIAARTIVMQRKTRRPVQFEIAEQTRDSVSTWITKAQLKLDQYLFPSRVGKSPHLSTRQYLPVAVRLSAVADDREKWRCRASALLFTRDVRRCETANVRRLTRCRIRLLPADGAVDPCCREAVAAHR
jgi:integrase